MQSPLLFHFGTQTDEQAIDLISNRFNISPKSHFLIKTIRVSNNS